MYLTENRKYSVPEIEDDLQESLPMIQKTFEDIDEDLGPGGGNAGNIFITGASSVTGGAITRITSYVANTIPSNYVLKEVTTNDTSIRLYFEVETDGVNYSPTVSIAGVVCTNLIQVVGDKRLYSGSVIVPITASGEITALSSSGRTYVLDVIKMSASGPSVIETLSMVIPVTQTEVKSGDLIAISVKIPNDADAVKTIVDNACGVLMSLTIGANDSAGTGFKTASGNVTVSNNSGALPIHIQAEDEFGTTGDVFTVGTVTLDQTFLQFTSTVTYPAGQEAFKNVEAGSVDCVCDVPADISSISFASTYFTIASPTAYVSNRVITKLVGSPVYNVGTTIVVTAVRTGNNAVTIHNISANVEQNAPSSNVISCIVAPSLAFKSGGLSNTDVQQYIIKLTSDQELSSVSIGLGHSTNGGSLSSFQPVGEGSIWEATLTVHDSDEKITSTGTPPVDNVFSWVVNGITNKSGLSYNVLNNPNYKIKGFVERTLMIGAYPDNNVFIGTAIGNYQDIICFLDATQEDGSFETFVTNYSEVGGAFTLVNASNIYDPNGSYFHWNNKNSIANTSGTATVTIEELGD